MILTYTEYLHTRTLSQMIPQINFHGNFKTTDNSKYLCPHYFMCQKNKCQSFNIKQLGATNHCTSHMNISKWNNHLTQLLQLCVKLSKPSSHTQHTTDGTSIQILYCSKKKKKKTSIPLWKNSITSKSTAINTILMYKYEWSFFYYSILCYFD